MRLGHLVLIMAGVLMAAPLVAPTSVRAQETAPSFPRYDPLFEFGPLGSVRNMRPSGMPVIPIFGGWIDNEDGTGDLCFGYKSLNLEERREIPFGPDNFIEPARFDGVQPTFFLEVPPGGWHRHYCVFTVRVLQGSEPVYWTLKHNGYEYKTPGHTGSINYLMDNTWYPADRGADGARRLHSTSGRVPRAGGVGACGPGRQGRQSWAGEGESRDSSDAHDRRHPTLYRGVRGRPQAVQHLLVQVPGASR